MTFYQNLYLVHIKRYKRVSLHVCMCARGLQHCPCNRLHPTCVGGDTFGRALFNPRCFAIRPVSEIRGFMRAAVYTSVRWTLLNSVDRPLKIGSDAVNPTARSLFSSVIASHRKTRTRDPGIIRQSKPTSRQ